MAVVRERLIEYLMDPYQAENPGRAVSEIAFILNMPKSTASGELRQMRNEGLIEVKTFGIKKQYDMIALKE